MMKYRRISFLITAVCASVLVGSPALATSGTTPQAPTNLRVTATDYSSVSLAWDAAPGTVAYYQILRNGWWVNSSYGTTGTVRSLSAGTAYTMEVRSRDVRGSVSASAVIRVTTRADAGPPTTPENLRVVNNSAGAPVGVAWDASTDDRGVGSYWLLADGGIVFGGGRDVDFFTLTDVECTLFSGATYNFTVRATDLSGNVSASSTPLTIRVP